MKFCLKLRILIILPVFSKRKKKTLKIEWKKWQTEKKNFLVSKILYWLSLKIRNNAQNYSTIGYRKKGRQRAGEKRNLKKSSSLFESLSAPLGQFVEFVGIHIESSDKIVVS